MNNHKGILALGLLLASVFILPAARADEWNQATKLTFNQSIQIPGRVLPAGTYWFVLADDNIVQIFNSDRSTLCANLLTINAERLGPTDHTAFTFAERESMPSNTIVTWFYPGFTSGHEFVYPRSERRELAQAKHQTIMAMEPVNHDTVVSGG